MRSGTKANALRVKRRKRGNVDGPNTVGERFLYVMKAGHTYKDTCSVVYTVCIAKCHHKAAFLDEIGRRLKKVSRTHSFRERNWLTVLFYILREGGQTVRQILRTYMIRK